MSGFAGQRSRPWMGDAAASDQAAAGGVGGGGGDVRDDGDGGAASAAAAKGLGDASTNASAISFGFAATAILISMFLLMAIFEHLIKPRPLLGLPRRRRRPPPPPGPPTATATGTASRRRPNTPPAAAAGVSPDKLFCTPGKLEVVPAEDLTVLMPGQRYPTFLAQPAPLLPWPREGVRWPPHGHRHCFVPP
ncbi:hypothetical protein OsJ_18614 [Oryza sativa Japonica Group]|uniref:Uncharacterized protein n=1 Tax=Oryza sativa subsp. japonica TaxID=39947 RepID=B9FIX3_ORYSJ|nr:hypothetical protein OsJ_18614 [Oryza sativa Japonica Group]